MNIPILVSLAVYGVLMLCVSLILMRRVHKAVDYLMGGRSLPTWVQIGTLTATGIGTGVTVGAAGLAYSGGWAGCVYPVGLGVGVLLTGWLFAKMRRYQFMTLGEEISCYYEGNKILYNFVNVLLCVSQIFWLTVQVMGGGFVLSVLTGLPPKVCMVAAGVLIATTALPGGLMTVVYTDVVQAVILVVGFMVLNVVAISESGGMTALFQRVPETYNSLFGYQEVGVKTVVGIFAALSLSIFSDPCRRLIMYSGKSERGGQIAMQVSGWLQIVFSVLVVIAGVYAYALNPAIEAQDQALPWLITEALPTWLAAMVVIAVVAAVFSSGNSNAAAAGTFFVRHVFPMMFKGYPQRPLLVIRLTMVVVFISATVMALFAGNIVNFVVSSLSVLISGMSILVLLGKLWPRATWEGGVACLVAAAVVSLIVMFVPSQKEFWVKPVIPASLAGLIVHVAVSLMTKRRGPDFDEMVEKMSEQRAGIDS